MTAALRLVALGFASALLAGSCAEREPAPPQGPNVLWIVWDTVRADHLSAYGYERDTTPYLARLAESSLVFDNCLSPASSTIPAHASMFTGLLPSEHGANNKSRWLEPFFQTIAEIYRDAGWGTYLFSANPNIQVLENFHQGFDVEEHPWDPERRERALEILRAKSGRDRSTGMSGRFASGEVEDHELKACGELAQEGLLAYLDRLDAEGAGRPYFAFLNYMEAHAPLLPPERFRRRFMDDEGVEASYTQDRSWATKWAYTYGFRELPDGWFDVYRATYDAALAELDELLERLMEALEERGALDDTIVVLTADHGEHLGDHGLIDHRYSLYQALVRVPLVVHWPGRVEPARSDAAVANLDLFQTLLDAAGLERPRGLPAHSRNLLEPMPDGRLRVAEYPDTFPLAPSTMVERPEDWDPRSVRGRRASLVRDGWKLIWSEHGDHKLYDLTRDPDEANDLADEEPARRDALLAELARVRDAMRVHTVERVSDMSAEERRRLGNLGYAGEDEEQD